MANTRDANFRFHIDNDGDSCYFEHSHPVPAFLCEPDPNQQASQQFYEAFVDVVSIVTVQHHDECMKRITTPCVGCGSAAKDALKAPLNCLNLFEPMVIIEIAGWCGTRVCEGRVRQHIIDKQNKSVSIAQEDQRNVVAKMDCEVCQKPDSKRCAGCGRVAYCGAECQKSAWKSHKRDCRRRNLKQGPQPGLPYEAI